MATNSQAIEKELSRLHKKHGRLTPEILVTEAKNPKNPLHNRFEWKNAIAAEKFRLQQARDIIECSRFVFQLQQERNVVLELEMRSFLPTGEKTAKYNTRNQVLSSTVQRKAFIEERMIALRGWAKSVADIQELQPIVKALKPFL
jgi:hypothetical protein